MKEIEGGLYDKGLCGLMQNMYRMNETVLQEYYQKEHGLDMMKTMDTMKQSMVEWDNIFTSKMFGFKDASDYHTKC